MKNGMEFWLPGDKSLKLSVSEIVKWPCWIDEISRIDELTMVSSVSLWYQIFE